MKLSWKFVVLLICVSMAVQYTAILSFQRFYTRTSLDSRKCLNCPETDYSWKSSYDPAPAKTHPRRHILLFSQTRSGSSFAGQLFNQHPDIFYLFEPLYHVQQTFCDGNNCSWKESLNKAFQVTSRDLLFNLYNCDLNFLENYIFPEPKEHMTDDFFRQSASRALCSPPVCQEGINNSEVMTDEYWCHTNCKPLNLTLASMTCQSRRHVSIKVVRMPDITELRSLAEDPRLDLRIIHLVRDPRALLASRMSAFDEYSTAWKIWNATNKKPHDIDLEYAIRPCQDMKYSVHIGLNRPAWLRNRYLLVRYEDLAIYPETKAREIYQFLNIDIDDDVLSWLSQNTKANSSSSAHYSTSRNSKTTSESWRRHLSFDIVKTVQTLCGDTLSLLGYKFADSEEQLRNMETSFVEPRIFL